MILLFYKISQKAWEFSNAKIKWKTPEYKVK